eukprot:PhF_6_TR43005/c0_g2_i1/m.65687
MDFLNIIYSEESSRVKRICFHPTKPLFVLAYYNGNITLYNHEKNVILWEFDGNDNQNEPMIKSKPIRCVDFHPFEDTPLFASCGDDFKIRIWNYDTETCSHTLH